ncbi:MAG TPA: hypothetical protein VEV41_05725 [Terriglobales bacterium]|nr:hypothetical protein [Terriglobales bacterium]
MRTFAKVLIVLCGLLLVTAPGWTVFFARKWRGKIVLGLVLVGLLSLAALLLRK